MRLKEQGIAMLIQQLEGILAEVDLKDWDKSFVSEILENLKRSGSTAFLSEKQYAQVERILFDEAPKAVRDDPPPNKYPYEADGGTSYYQKRGYDTKRHRRK